MPPARLNEYVCFSDESCTTSHAYMIIGGVLCSHSHEAAIARDIDRIHPGRPDHWAYEWKSVRDANLGRYRKFIDLFFEWNREHSFDFRCLVVECAKLDHATFNE